jgi:hypothetical protein
MNFLIGTNGSLIFNTTGSNQQSSILFRSGNNPTSDYGYIKYDDTRTVGGTGENALLTIGIENDIDDHIAIMSGTGNEGIGITVPTSKLHVNGTLGVAGKTTLNDDLTVFGKLGFGENTDGSSYRLSSTEIASFGGNALIQGQLLLKDVRGSGINSGYSGVMRIGQSSSGGYHHMDIFNHSPFYINYYSGIEVRVPTLSQTSDDTIKKN